MFSGCANSTLMDEFHGTISLSLPSPVLEVLTRDEAVLTFEPGAGTLIWWSAGNTMEKRQLTSQEAETGTVTLSLLKGSVTPVLLYQEQVFSYEDLTPETLIPVSQPMGCIWPVTSTMDERGGFASRMLWRLLTETHPVSGSPESIRDFCARFNWKRFTEEIATCPNPWELDQQKILRTIAAGMFTSNCLK